MSLLNSIDMLRKSQMLPKAKKRQYFHSSAFFFALFILVFVSNIKGHVISGKDPDINSMTVVIDAGHGGKDPGAIGVNGLKEKDIALYVALGLGKMIEENFDDVKVIYTRDTDDFVTLYNRAKIANVANADLFISIHANAAVNSSAYGTETSVLGLHKNEQNLEVAKRENRTILMEENYEVTYEGFDPNSVESYIALTLQQSAYLENSLSIASKIQDEFTSIGRRNRGVKQAGFLVLAQTTMPSILIETGFVTNKNEGSFLSNNSNKDKMIATIFNAFKKYKGEITGRTDVSKPVIDAVVVEGGKPKEKKEKQTTLLKENVHFKVQVASSKAPIKTIASNFKGLEEVEEFKVDNVYKYTIGNEIDYQSALELQRKIRADVYPDAFLVAFYKNEKISVTEALKIQKSLKENNP